MCEAIAWASIPSSGEHGMPPDNASHICFGISLMVAFLWGCAGHTKDQVQQHAGHSLGTVVFPITCSEQAQVEFNRAVALLHHMTYPQAREAFPWVGL